MKSTLIENLVALVRPIVEELNYELYHIEYVREKKDNFLKIYIDKEDGISIEDCEKVSRRVSDMLDEEDPINDSYFLEVSSPGIERILHNDSHMSKNLNKNVLVKFKKLLNGKRSNVGILKSFDEGNIVLLVDEEEVSVPRDKVDRISLKGEF